jgi:hypothetical protein
MDAEPKTKADAMDGGMESVGKDAASGAAALAASRYNGQLWNRQLKRKVLGPWASSR